MNASALCKPYRPFLEKRGTSSLFPLAGIPMSVIRTAIWMRTCLLPVEESRTTCLKEPGALIALQGRAVTCSGLRENELLSCLC